MRGSSLVEKLGIGCDGGRGKILRGERGEWYGGWELTWRVHSCQGVVAWVASPIRKRRPWVYVCAFSLWCIGHGAWGSRFWSKSQFELGGLLNSCEAGVLCGDEARAWAWNWRVDPRCKRGVEGVVIDIFLSVCLVGFPRRRWGDVTTEALHLYRENRLRSQTTPDLQTIFSKASPHTDVRKPR